MPRLSRLILFGILLRNENRPCRKAGNKSGGLTLSAYDSGVIDKVQAFWRLIGRGARAARSCVALREARRMNLIWFSAREARALQFNLAHPAVLAILGVLVLGILGTAFALGVKLGERTGKRINQTHATAAFNGALDDEKREIEELRAKLKDRVDAMALRLGTINAHILRLNALGKRLADMAKINNREFNFDAEPATGGPESDGEGVSAQIPDLNEMLDSTERRVELRDAQLNALENVILVRKLNEEIQPEGRPVHQGFISSYFGQRQDPFTGEEAIHKGVDFAGNLGDEVVAVAAGVVTWAGVQPGYGKLVEISHGNGLVTRYAHNQRALVNVGDTVTRGEPIALMGSSGRSTGPHVHFEVLRNGRQVDPLTFIGH
jgi:murein DD-endopeptidase MepM/ murein hydrolase activator NlpD